MAYIKGNETLENLKERLDKEQDIREKQHTKTMKKIADLTDKAWGNLQNTVIFNYKLDQMDEQLKEMAETTHSLVKGVKE